MSDPGLYLGGEKVATNTPDDRLVPSPVGQDDGRILITEDDALVYASRGAVGVTVTRSSNQTIAVDTDVPIEFTAESDDGAGFADLGADNKILTIPPGLGGWYIVTGMVKWAPVTGLGRWILIDVNGAPTWQSSQIAAGDHNDPYMLASGPLYLADAATVSLVVRHNRLSATVNVSQARLSLVAVG